MPDESPRAKPDELALIQGGPSHRLAVRLGLASPNLHRRLANIGLLMLVTWFPLALHALLTGRAFGDRVGVTFSRDPEVHARFLFVLPLLVLSEGVVAMSLAVQTRHLRHAGIVPEQERSRFDAAWDETVELRGSLLAEGVIVAIAYLTAIVLRLQFGFSEGKSSWERVESSLTLAGWWHTLVSLPILYFFLLRWVWVFLLWSKFLYRVSRLDLQLTATHADRTGGLGFLGWGLASYGMVLMAVSAVVSAGLAHEILHAGESLESLKYHVFAFIAVALAIVHAPLLSFAGRLARCRFSGLLEFGELVWRHDRAFDEKWIRNAPDDDGRSLLGSADIQSLADVATCYEHVDRMWLMPFDAKAFAVLVLAVLLPIIPLVGTAIPLDEIFMKLGELLV